jgi:hypothetical protein
MIVNDVTGGLGSFNSEFRTNMMNGTTNSELTLVLALCLSKVTKAAQPTIQDTDGTTFQVLDWTHDGWERFKRNFQQMGQSFWTGKFWLVAPNGTTDLQCSVAGRTYQCNVWCRLRIVVQETPAGAHHVIRAVRVKPNSSAPMTASTFRSNDSLYDQYDLGIATYVRNGRTYRQRTFIHEIGHALGLPHIAVMTNNAACPAANTNADVCYGTVDEEQRDIMGFGHQLSLRDGLPWQSRIFSHITNPSFVGPPQAYTIAMRRVFPRVI